MTAMAGCPADDPSQGGALTPPRLPRDSPGIFFRIKEAANFILAQNIPAGGL